MDEGYSSSGRRASAAVLWVVVVAVFAAIVLVVPTEDGESRLAAEDKRLRSLVQQKLWYGSAAGRPGVVLGTWESQNQLKHQHATLLGLHQSLQQRQLLDGEAAAEPAAEPPAEPAEPAPAEGSAAKEPVADTGNPENGAVAAAAAVVQPPPPACDNSCKSSYDTGMAEVLKMENEVVRLQGTCTAMMKLFDCECMACGPNLEGADALQKTLCSPDGLVQLHQAGEACSGFATGFCAHPISSPESTFCSAHTWIPPMGSPAWLKAHQVVAPAQDAGPEYNLVKNQAPAYAEKVANAMSAYLMTGAAQKRSDAKLESLLSGEIASLRHVHKNMGIFSFLPFNVPFMESVDKQDKAVLKEDHKLQLKEFGEELSPSMAYSYGEKIKGVERSLSEKGVELPGKIETELNELVDSAEHYNGPTDDAILGVDLPHVEMPHVDLPKVDLPKIEIKMPGS